MYIKIVLHKYNYWNKLDTTHKRVEKMTKEQVYNVWKDKLYYTVNATNRHNPHDQLSAHTRYKTNEGHREIYIHARITAVQIHQKIFTEWKSGKSRYA